MGIHREGKTWLLVSLILWFSVTIVLYFVNAPIIVFSIVSSLLGLVFLLLLQFFRVPYRVLQINHEHILSPADGKVVVIERTYEPEYLKKEVIQISIFMSPFNVHKNWYPVSGKIEYCKYHPGKYLVAWHPKSSTENERNTIVIRRNDNKKILVRQIAGILARKICCYAKENHIIQQGDELGFIKFGSRVDVFLPLESEVKVKINDKVKGSQTILALLK